MNDKLKWAKFYKSIKWHTLPIQPGTKQPYFKLLPKDAEGKATWDPYKDRLPTDAELKLWFEDNDSDIAVIPGQSGFGVIDNDTYKNKLGGEQIKLHSTLEQDSRSGGLHYLYKCPPNLRPSVNGELGIDVKGFDSYVLVYPSRGYKWRNVSSKEEFLAALKDLPALPLEYLKKIQPAKQPGKKLDWELLKGLKDGGGRNDAMLRHVRSALARGATKEEALIVAQGINAGFGDQLDDAELKQVLQHAVNYAEKETNIAFPKPSWPDPLDEAAYHGLAGEFVKLVEPHSEGDPVYLLTGFLTAAGNIVGNNPYIQVEQTRHRLKLFTLHVGPTAKGRKGTAWDRVRPVFDQLDTAWSSSIVNGGLATGEGLVNAVKDPVTKMKDGQEVTVEEGVKDKRLLVVEPEFASVLKVMNREHNILSPILRSAWDRGDLRTLTKTSPLKATGTHISVIGHIVQEELLRCLNSTEMANGFANRLLIFTGKRSKNLPFGGNVPFAELNQLTNKIFKAVSFGRDCGEITFDNNARELWIKIYNDLTADEPGIIGSMSARIEPYTLRLAGIYAVLDSSNQINPEHLRAAVAVIDYYIASLYYLFGNLAGNPLADRIFEALTDKPDGMSKNDLMDYFQRNKTSDEISTALDLLTGMERIKSQTEKTSGRDITVYNLTSLNSLSRTTFPKTSYLEKLDSYISQLNLIAGTDSKNTSYEKNEIDEKRFTTNSLLDASPVTDKTEESPPF